MDLFFLLSKEGDHGGHKFVVIADSESCHWLDIAQDPSHVLVDALEGDRIGLITHLAANNCMNSF